MKFMMSFPPSGPALSMDKETAELVAQRFPHAKFYPQLVTEGRVLWRRADQSYTGSTGRVFENLAGGGDFKYRLTAKMELPEEWDHFGNCVAQGAVVAEGILITLPAPDDRPLARARRAEPRTATAKAVTTQARIVSEAELPKAPPTVEVIMEFPGGRIAEFRVPVDIARAQEAMWESLGYAVVGGDEVK